MISLPDVRRGPWTKKLIIGMAAFLLVISQGSMANPTGGRVTAGAASIGPGGGTLRVDQFSNRAIIEWQQFSIDSGELTEFVQPSADAAALNRVVGADPSSILGRLEANGRVYLINPNGVVVGPGGRIDAQSFLASTLDVDDAEFLSGGTMRFSGGSDAAVVNLGRIEAVGGDVYLLAREVRNEGEIRASGVAGLAGGGDVLLIPDGNERLAVQVTGASGRVSNSGRIEAAQAELKAVGNNPFALAINQSGVVRAHGFSRREDGTVVLSAEQGATVVDGAVEAPGGRIDVLGDAVSVSGRIDASGETGGGEINIGGDYQGQGALKLARETEVTGSAVVRADGLGDAHGGQIVVWSEEHTVVDAQLSARGGPTGGDGGMIETSSRGLLEFSVPADVSAPAGAGGTWLLDPEDIDIGDSEAESIESTLDDGGNVHVKTADDGDEEGNINVNAPITKSEGDDSELTLTAHNDVNINAPITNVSEEGDLDVNVNAGRGASRPEAADTQGPSGDTAGTDGGPAPEGGNDVAGESAPPDPATADLSEQTGNTAEMTAGPEVVAEPTVQPETVDEQVAETGPRGDAGTGVTETGDPGPGAGDTVTGSSGPSLVVGADVVTGGGQISLDNSRAESGSVTVDAGLDASSETGTGGGIEVLGDTVRLTDNARVDASGATGGGTVHIGGAYQGNGDTPTAQNTTVAEGATIKANATQAGDGGEVVVWAEQRTEFRGNIEAKGIDGGAGGRVEVSGKQDLLFRGDVDTGGGTLLLDPENVLVSNAGGSTITPGDLVTQLGANNVTLDTSGVGADAGTLTIDDDVFYDSENDLTLLAHSDVHFNASVQNRNETGGDINIVAGWNGTTAFDLTTYTGQDVTTTTLFGNDMGSVNVGDGNQTTGLAVGSRSGSTNVFAYDLNITAGSGDDGRFAQLGFQVTDGVALDGTDLGGAANDGSDDAVTGTLRAHVVNDITAMGGSTDDVNYAQLGHVGTDQAGNAVEAVVNADIHIAAGNNLEFSGGSGSGAYVQLGHGGESTEGGHNGNIAITESDDLNFSGGSGPDSYTQLGHGGESADGDHGGSITITSANDLTFSGGTAFDAYAQLGHGGEDAEGNRSGSITLTSVHDLTFEGGTEADVYAQLGHGGATGSGVEGNLSGDITITSANDLVFRGGTDEDTYAQLGHGGVGAIGNHSGSITITSANDVTFRGGTDFVAYAQLGHGGFFADGDHGGSITITSANNLTLAGGSQFGAYAQMGHGDDAGTLGTRMGDIDVTITGETSLVDGSESNTDWVIGHRTDAAGGVSSANVTLITDTLDYDDTATSFEVTLNQDFADEFVDNLAGGHVTIGATDGMEVVGDFFHDEPNNLSFLSTDDLQFNASVQNRNDTSGDINLVAGWDGASGVASPFDPAAFIAADVATTTLFGDDLGSVHIGDGDQTTGIAVGSRSGATNVFAHNLNITAGSGGDGRFAQLGFQVTDGVALDGTDLGTAPLVTGGIRAHVVGDINAMGGSTDELNYAQLGHVGGEPAFADATVEASVMADIHIAAGNDLTFNGGAGDFASAQLGHGGSGTRGGVGGAIMIAEADDVTFSAGGGGNAYAQLGHGGSGADAELGEGHSGSITITEVNDLNFSAGSGPDVNRAYAQLGHGGSDADGSHNGDITITEANHLVFSGGDTNGIGIDSYAQLGHGGRGADGDLSGTITIIQANDLSLTGGSGSNAYAQLGHGDNAEGSTGTRMGDIDVTVTGETSLVNGTGSDTDWVIGHRTATGALSNANVTLITGTLDYDDAAASTLATLNQDFADKFAENVTAGHVTIGVTNGTAGDTGGMQVEGNFFYDSANNLSFLSTNDLRFNASVQNLNDTGGDVNAVAGWDGASGVASPFDPAAFIAADVATTTLFGDDLGSVNIGDGNQTTGIAVGSRSGATNVFAHDLNITAGSGGDGRFAQLGFQVTDGVALDGTDLDPVSGDGANVSVTGGIRAHVVNDISAMGGSTDDSNYAQFGHVGGVQAASNSTIEALVNADVHIVAGNDLTFSGDTGFGSYAQLGHGGNEARGDFSGAIMVAEANDIAFNGGSASDSYAHLGHGGEDNDGNQIGLITISSANNLTFRAGDGTNSYSQLGHGGRDADGDHGGNITIFEANNLNFSGGGGDAFNNYAQLGHGGEDAEGSHSGNITIAEVGDLNFSGGVGIDPVNAYAQLGHGGDDADNETDDAAPGHSGDITIGSAQDLNFIGGSDSNNFARLGHGGNGASGTHGGSITITQANDLIFSGGSGGDAHAQLGHGGVDAGGNHGGSITIAQANDLDFSGGTGNSAYAQLGHGGVGADGSHSGPIDLNLTGDLTFTGLDTADRYALIGHGDEPSELDAAGDTVSGDVLVRVGRDATLTNAFIGHQIDDDGTYASGNTFVGVGRDITADESSEFNSAPNDGAGDGELRIYVGTASNDLIDPATLMNGTAHGAMQAPNNQGQFAFGLGPYNVPGSDVPGNFNYYTLPEIFNYIVGGTEAGNIEAALAGGEVTLTYDLNQPDFGALFDVDGGSQFVRVDSDIFYDSPSDLNLLATGDAIFTASVQNLNDTGGAVNIVGGWDGVTGRSGGAGTTAFDISDFAGEDVTSTTVFGVDDPSDVQNGSVYVGDSMQTGPVAVGSRTGDTNVFANHLNLFAGSGADGRFAQLGFQATNGVALDGTDLGGTPDDGSDDAVTGTIRAHVVNGITAAGGSTDDFNYAQLGHVGADPVGDTTIEAAVDANIHIAAGGDLTFSGGDGGAVNNAQLGHGGAGAGGNHSGAITIVQANDLVFSGGTASDTYAQLGHGGESADGNHGGDLTIAEANNLAFSAGDGNDAYAHLGHGGRGVAGSHAGNIAITAAGDLDFSGGGGLNSYAQLGHGGQDADGNHSGAITLTSANDLTFNGGTNANAYAQLGHGGVGADGNHSGGIDLTLTGYLTLTGQDTDDQYTLIGHGDEPGNGDAGDTVSGDVLVRVGRDATLTNAFIGHQIDDDGDYMSGNTFVGVGRDIIADAASQFNSAPNDGAGDGELRIYVGTAANDLIDPATLMNGTAHGAMQAPNNQGQFAFGLGPYNVPGADVAGNFNYYTLPEIFNYIVGGTEAGNIEAALAGGEVTLTYDLNQPDFGALFDVDGGSQFVRVDSDIFYDSPNDMNLLATGDAIFTASVQNRNDTGGAVNIVGGWDGVTGRPGGAGTIPFDISGFAAEDVTSTTVYGVDPADGQSGGVYVGDGSQTGPVAVGSRTGETNVFANHLNLLAGSGGNGRFAQLGFQATDGVALDGTDLGGIPDDGSDDPVTGTIRARVVNDITAAGGSTDDFNYAQLGHVGADQVGGTVDAAVDADIDVAAGGDLAFSGGAGFASYAQLGHGGFLGDGSYDGLIELTLDGDLTLTGQNTTDRYALIGHGNQPGNDDTGNTVSGDVLVQAGAVVRLTNAFIGHLTDVPAKAGVGYTSGDTFIGAGGALAADAASQFNSAPTVNGGELRFYITAAANDLIDPATLLNGIPHGPLQAPNPQGVFPFGDGPYNPDLAVGNFAFYTLPAPPPPPPAADGGTVSPGAGTGTGGPPDGDPTPQATELNETILAEAGQPAADEDPGPSFTGDVCNDDGPADYAVDVLVSASSFDQDACGQDE